MLSIYEIRILEHLNKTLAAIILSNKVRSCIFRVDNNTFAIEVEKFPGGYTPEDHYRFSIFFQDFLRQHVIPDITLYDIKYNTGYPESSTFVYTTKYVDYAIKKIIDMSNGGIKWVTKI